MEPILPIFRFDTQLMEDLKMAEERQTSRGYEAVRCLIRSIRIMRRRIKRLRTLEMIRGDFSKPDWVDDDMPDPKERNKVAPVVCPQQLS